MSTSTPESEIKPSSTPSSNGEAESWSKLCKRLSKAQAKLAMSSITWNLPASEDEDALKWPKRLMRLVQGKKKPAQRLVDDLNTWLEATTDQPLNRDYAVECLAFAYALPTLTEHLEEQVWHKLVARLQATVFRGEQAPLEKEPLLNQWLAGELAWVLGYCLNSSKIGALGANVLNHGIHEMLDGDGIPASRYFSVWRPLLACWTRAARVSKAIRITLFDGDSKHHFEWTVRQMIRATRGDGSHALSTDSAGRPEPEFFATAIELGGDNDDRDISQFALPGGKPKKLSQLPLPECGAHSEWAGVALMRKDWTRKAHGATVLYGNRDLELELRAGKRVLIGGQYECRININGKDVDVTEDWQEVCWHSDDDVQYLEIETQLSSGHRLQRQVLLVLESGITYLADSVTGDSPVNWEYEVSLPLGAGLRLEPEAESHEAAIHSDKQVGVVLPLALPEWRRDHTRGDLTEDDGKLVYRVRGNGTAFYAPLLIDMKAKRSRKALTWRRLTVASKLEIQPSDVAAAYRARIGDDQWLFYRSLAATANRTFCGQNVNSEFVAMQIDTDGETDELIELE